ncbi:MAG: molybdopterin-dependent oxidoreductase [Rhodobacter sp.]|nr:molybdopterin-dependent oxidoreductase [Rhodobacter sp.]
MSRLGTIARRTFLIGSVAIAGGVAFGVYMARRPHPNPLAAGLAEGEATFNPWVKIDADGITLITPHSDVGQGVRHMQAMLIAEEMDLDPGQFTTDFGPPDPAYWNRAFSEEGAPFMSRDDSWGAETARTVVGYVVKIFGIQATGGSTAVADSFDKLREAGAVARETLKLAAAQRSGVPVANLTTAGAAVTLPDGTQIAYTDLAAEAAALDPVTDVTLRDPSEWRLIGKPQRRLDIVEKSTGTATYGIDLALDGMVHATVRFNPRQGGALNGYDASAAEAMRGVQKILPVTNGVAVIADNTWRAFQAADAIEYDWAEAPYPAEQDDHWAALSASFTEDRLDDEWRHEGDVPAALAAADPIEAEYRAPYVAHAPLEPLNALILVTDARVDIWAGHQIPRTVEDMVAGITGHDVADVHFHNQYAGGSFGHRLEFENIRYAAEIGAQMKDTPVKLTFSREEDFAHDYPRQIAMARGAGAVTDGAVTTYDLSIASPSPIASQMPRAGFPAPPGPDMQIVAGAWNMPYKIDNLRVRAYRAPELAPVSSWRSVGASHAGFFAEGFLDELIHAAGRDPLEARIGMCDYDVARKVLEAVGEMSNWGSELGAGRGRGVAFVSSFGTPTAEVVEVTATEDGIKIDRVFVAADVGRVVDPVNFENHVQGAVVWGLGHAMNCEITYADGMAEQSNYDWHEAMRLYQCPEIVVRGLENQPKIRGIGEPPVPPAAPALANAIFAATGQRLREMPFNKFVEFV